MNEEVRVNAGWITAHLLDLCSQIIARSPEWVPHKSYSPELHIIINPTAGGFIKEARRTAFFNELEFRLKAFLPMPLVCTLEEARSRIRVHVSQAPGGGTVIARAILARGFEPEGGSEYEALESNPQDQVRSNKRDGYEPFVVSIGGDGTHLEVLNGLIEGLNEVTPVGIGLNDLHGGCPIDPPSPGVGFCRVPMGTGNDGVDLLSAGDVMGVIYARGGSSCYTAGAVRVSTAPGEVTYAGNIAGLGLDAYVVFLSERYKRILPGNIYKFAADLGVLSYKSRYNLGLSRIKIDTSEGTSDFELMPGIICMGAGGYRTYGNGLPVLPGPENTCIIPMGTVAQNIALKRQLYQGSHGSDLRVRLCSAGKMTVDYQGRLPMQLDGEVRWIEEQDFPIEFQVVSIPGICIIGNRNNDADIQIQRSRYQEPAALFPERYPDNA